MFFADDYAFLSNFYPAVVKIRLQDGSIAEAPTVEHAFQALKATTTKAQLAILEETTPGRAKRRGRTIQLRSDWLTVKDDLMLKLLRQKFRYNPELREKLLATGDARLVEDNNWHDNYWGICRCGRTCPGTGSNRLGKLLMQVREELQDGNGTPT